MAEKANVLFILFEGLADTVIDSQVLSHVAVMQKCNVADFEIWAFACDDENYQKSCAKIEKSEQTSGARVRVFRGVRPAYLGSMRKNAEIIEQALAESKRPFTHIHARTEYSAAVVGHVKDVSRYSLIWDCRGDGVAELDYRYNDGSLKSRLIKALHRHILQRRLRLAGNACDRALFVSEPLRDVMKSYIGHKPSEIVPCCASRELFFYDADLRARVRNELGFGEGQKIYTYVGSLAPYQRFDDTVACFKAIAQVDANSLMFVLTPDLEKAEIILEREIPGRYILRHGVFSEINGYLNASDCAFMLRDSTPTNRVATPTKFAEYCLTGLPIVMGKAVEACFKIANEVGNIVDESDIGSLVNLPQIDRKTVSEQHQIKLTREGQKHLYAITYKIKQK